jgi:CRISPR/Cas system-associated endonuclease Cas3-HD
MMLIGLPPIFHQIGKAVKEITELVIDLIRLIGHEFF